MIKIGDRLPSSNLTEFVPFEGEGCSIGPAVVKLPDALTGKTVAIVAVPGAFTPTCSEKHVPGFLDALPQLKAKGVVFTMEPNTIRPGVRIAFLRAPENVSIELLERSAV